jgi:hypothetical protein
MGNHAKNRKGSPWRTEARRTGTQRHTSAPRDVPAEENKRYNIIIHIHKEHGNGYAQHAETQKQTLHIIIVHT